MKLERELARLAEGDEAAVAPARVPRKRVLGSAGLVAAGLVGAGLLLAGEGSEQRDLLDSDEVFSTTSFRPPAFVRDFPSEPAEPVPQIVTLPEPEEEVPEATEFEVPPPPPLPPPEDPFPARWGSAMLVLDQSGPGAPQTGSDGGGGQTVPGEDHASRFLSAVAGQTERSIAARSLDRIDALVPEGTLIPGILETAIVSDLPGQVRAVVAEDVYSFDGRRVLIPAGSRLIGTYQSEMLAGQRRIFVVWTRLMRHDGVSIRLDSIGADGLGRAGLAGRVDNRLAERFGAAVMLSIVGGTASWLAGQGNGGARAGRSRDGADQARASIARSFAGMAGTVLDARVNLAPTLSVRQGKRIFVFVRQDLDFSDLYDDPVSQALEEIRRERAPGR